MSAPRFGIGMRADPSPAESARLGRLAEELGFDVVSVFGDLGDPPPMPALLAIAAATNRVTLGPACLNPYTMRPVEIAGAMADLDAASNGRAYLGLARGAWLETIGVAQPMPVRTIRDAAAFVRSRLGSHLPLLIGSWGPETVTMAGEIADELKVGGSANPGIVPVMRERLDAGAARAGRPAESTDIVLGAVTVVDHDGGAARRWARTAVAKYFEVVASLDPTLRLPAGLMEQVRGSLARGDAAGAGEAIPDELLDRFCLAGTPEEVSRHVRLVLTSGASRVEFGQPFGLQPDEGLRLLAGIVSELR
jgi:5,10-methylenetetrahydromethanopterin reductase